MEEDTDLSVNLNLLAKASIFVFIGLILSKIFAYIYRIVIARNFGPEAYGYFSLALMVSMIFLVVSSLGLFDGLLRYIPYYNAGKNKSKIAYLVKFTFGFLMFASLTAAIVMFFSSDFLAIRIFHDSNLAEYFRIFSFLIPLTSFFYLYIHILRAFEFASAYSFFQNILSNLIRIILLVILIFFGLGSRSISYSYVMGMGIVLVLSYAYCRKKLGFIFINYSDHVLRKKLRDELYKYSVPLMFTAFTGTILFWMDSFFLGYYKDVYSVGIYNVAFPIAALLAISPEMFIQLFAPMITKQYAQKKHDLIKKLSKYINKWILLINIPAIVALFVFPGAFINILFGQEFMAARAPLQILALGVFIFQSSLVSRTFLNMVGKSGLIFMTTVLSGLINLVLNIALIPKYGIIGASVATSISFGLMGLGFIIVSYYYTGIFPFKRKLFAILGISFVPVVIYLAVKQHIAINFWILASFGVLYLAGYLAFIFKFSIIDEFDMGLIIKILIKLGIKNRAMK